MHEARLLSKLKHTGIVELHDSFVDGEYFCMVTEYCGVYTTLIKMILEKIFEQI